ncbi:hypothetical protein OPQ81_008935 [Rhizoctonia solani]|nr:hypothetical protein OPQ81_008935 [Rhizoctonia solani]
MGRPSPPAYSAPVASTKLSGATRLFTFITLVVVSLGSGLVVLVEGVQEILGITQKSSGEELLAEQTDVKDNLKKLQKILYTFSRQISRINSGGLFAHIRRLVFPEDTHVNRAKQQFDSSRGLLLFGNFIDLLSKSLNLPAAGVEVPKPGQLETPEPSHSSNPQFMTSLVHKRGRAAG